MPVRILVIGFSPAINGISSVVMNLYRNLDRTRFQYDFLLDEPYRNYQNARLDEIRQLGGRLFFLDYSRANMPENSRRKLRKLLLAHPEIRGVHVHDTDHQTYPLLLAQELGLPIKVIHFHTAMPKSAPIEISTNSADYKNIQLIKGPQFVRLACCDLAGDFGYLGLPYQILANGVDTKQYSFSPLYRSIIRGQLHIAEDEYVFGFVANISPSKNPFFVLETFREILKSSPNSNLIMVGDGHYLKPFRDYLKNIDYLSRIHFYRTYDSVDMLYSVMDLLLLPSAREGIPLAAIEAQSTGLPCLVSDELSDMVKITPLVHISSLNETPSSWAKKALHILERNEPRIFRAGDIKKAGYDIQQVASQMMQIYQHCIVKV